MSMEEVDGDVPRVTQIRLMGLRGQYKGNCPKKIDTIARNILNHCFTYYVLGKAPKIIVHDEFDTVDVDELYSENIGDNTKIVDVDIKGIPFKIVHSKNYMKTKEKHTVNLCANHWVVQPISLSKIFGNVNTKLEDNKGEFTYSGYVMSELPIIGTFRSIGATQKTVTRILMLESALYGCIGVSWGFLTNPL